MPKKYPEKISVLILSKQHAVSEQSALLI